MTPVTGSYSYSFLEPFGISTTTVTVPGSGDDTAGV
jgi:hypothetical protein